MENNLLKFGIGVLVGAAAVWGGRALMENTEVLTEAPWKGKPRGLGDRQQLDLNLKEVG